MRGRKIRGISEEVFAKLGREKLLHDYCNVIFKMLGLVIDYISAEDQTLRLSSGARFNPYCTALRNTPMGCKACTECDISNARRAAREKKSICYRCHAGLYEVVVPLFDSHGNYLGGMTSGQFHLNGEHLLSEEAVNTIAEQYGINAETLYRDYCSSLSVTGIQVEGITEFLAIIGKHLTGLHGNLIFLSKINTPAKIELIKKYIEDNYFQQLSVEEAARRHSMSPSNLAHMFKRELNVSFNRYLNSFRISKAKEMLENTDLNISEIAFAAGFGSISQFNRQFRSVTGCSAGEYRSGKTTSPAGQS